MLSTEDIVLVHFMKCWNWLEYICCCTLYKCTFFISYHIVKKIDNTNSNAFFLLFSFLLFFWKWQWWTNMNLKIVIFWCFIGFKTANKLFESSVLLAPHVKKILTYCSQSFKHQHELHRELFLLRICWQRC